MHPMSESSLQIEVTPTDRPVREDRLAEILANPGFGLHFTDHMFVVEWTPEKGWHDARVTPYAPLSVDPATAVLHYAQEIFEGMKAYRHEDGSVWTFRPEENAARMIRSAHRLALPELPVEDFIASVDALVRADERWVPRAGGGEEPLHPAVHVRLRGVPRGAALAARDLPGDRLARGRLLLQGRPAGVDLAERGLHARRPRRHGGGQDRRQLRELAGRPAGGDRRGLRPGGLPRRGRGEVRRGARRHEPLLRPGRRHDRHPGDVRHDPRGHHPQLDRRAVREARATGSRSGR